MPARKVIKIIKELNLLIKESYSEFKGLYLYGSQVKGTYHKNSDIDIIILFDSELSKREELDLAGIISEISYKYDVWVDYHPYTLSELKRNPFFYKEVVEKGIYYDRKVA